MTQAYDAVMELARVLHRSADLCASDSFLAAGLRTAGLMAEHKASEVATAPDWVTIMVPRHIPVHRNGDVACRTCGMPWQCDAARLLFWLTT